MEYGEDCHNILLGALRKGKRGMEGEKEKTGVEERIVSVMSKSVIWEIAGAC